jgi:hypothetical protein
MLDFDLTNSVLVVLLSIFTAHWFSPLQWLKHKLGYQGLPMFYLYDPFSCSKCLSFWLSLALFHSLTYAMLLSVTTYVVDFVLTLIERKLHE